MRTTTRTMLFAALWLGLALPLATPSRADDAPAEIVSLLERARAAERVEKDLAKAQALYEQVFAKAASTDAGREAGIRLLDLDAGRTHEAWLTLIGTLSEAHGAKLDEVTVDKIVELARRHVQPGEMVKTPRGTFFGVAQVADVPATASPADIALAKGFQQLGAGQWFRPDPPLDGAEMDLDRLLQGLGVEARPAVHRWLARGADPIPGLLALLRLDAQAGWAVVGEQLQTQSAAHRHLITVALGTLADWAEVSPSTLETALRPVLLAPNAEKVTKGVFTFLVQRVDSASIPSYIDAVADPALKHQAWQCLAMRGAGNPVDIERAAALIATRAPSAKDLDAVGRLLYDVQPGSGLQPEPATDPALVAARSKLALAILESPSLIDDVLLQRGMFLRTNVAQGLLLLVQAARAAASNPSVDERIGRAVGKILLRSPLEYRRHVLRHAPDDTPVQLRSAALGITPEVALGLLAAGADGRKPSEFTIRVRAEALAVPGVWDALLAEIATGSEESSNSLAWVLDTQPQPEWPMDIGPTCLRLVESVTERGGRVPPISCLEAAASQDPARYDEVVLGALRAFRVKPVYQWAKPLASADRDRIQNWLASLPSSEEADAKRIYLGELRHHLMWLLLEQGDAKAVEERAASQSDPSLAYDALGVLVGFESPSSGASLLRLAAADAADSVWMAGRGQDRAQWWLRLAERAPSPHLTSVLVAIYEHHPSPSWRRRAAEALDGIRDRQERLRYFDSMLDGPDDPEGEILPLLADEDVAVRQGAIQALGAVGGPRALVRLLKLAKREGAPASERAAALEAVAKISARAPGGAAPRSSPVPAASDDAR